MVKLSLDQDFLLHGPIEVGPMVINFEHGDCDIKLTEDLLFYGAPHANLYSKEFFERRYKAFGKSN